MYLNAGFNGPSLIFFEKTRKKVYRGDFKDPDTMRDFLFYNTERKLYNITTTVRDSFIQKEFYDFYRIPNKTKVMAVYYERMEYEIATFQQLVVRDIFADSGNFVAGITLDQSVIPIPSNLEQPSIVLYKEFHEEGETPISIFRGNYSNGHKIMDFCNTESLGLVTEYNEDNSYRLFGGPIPVYCILIKNQINLLLNPAKDNSKIEREFRLAAAENRKNSLICFIAETKWILFVKAEVGSRENEDFVDQFGITLKDTPAIFLSEIDHTLASLTKYEYIKDEIKKDYILDFIDEYLDKKLEIHYKSDPLPDNTDRKMRILVGKNFNQEVIKSEDNICVLFCSEKVPTHCGNAIKIFEFLAEHLPVEKYHKLKFGFFELARNEVEGLVVNDVPNVRLYKKGEKKKFKEFNMEFTIKNILIFLNYYIPGLRFKVSEQDLTDFAFENMPEEDKKNLEESKKQQEEQNLKGKIYEEVDFDSMKSRVQSEKFNHETADLSSFDKIETSENYRGPVQSEL